MKLKDKIQIYINRLATNINVVEYSKLLAPRELDFNIPMMTVSAMTMLNKLACSNITKK